MPHQIILLRIIRRNRERNCLVQQVDIAIVSIPKNEFASEYRKQRTLNSKGATSKEKMSFFAIKGQKE